MPFMAAVDKDLTPFKKRGGKLLMYTGWSDPVVPPQDTVAYYDAVVKTMGGIEKTRDFYRFFLAPGMGHCGGGPGPNQFDHLTALEQWVEKGDRAGQDDRHAQHGRQGRSHAAAVRLPAGRALERHRQHDEAANFACVAAPPPRRPSQRRRQRREVSDDAGRSAQALRARHLALLALDAVRCRRRPPRRSPSTAMRRARGAEAAGRHDHRRPSPVDAGIVPRARRATPTRRADEHAGVLPRRGDADADAGVAHQDRSLAAADRRPGTASSSAPATAAPAASSVIRRSPPACERLRDHQHRHGHVDDRPRLQFRRRPSRDGRRLGLPRHAPDDGGRQDDREDATTRAIRSSPTSWAAPPAAIRRSPRRAAIPTTTTASSPAIRRTTASACT